MYTVQLTILRIWNIHPHEYSTFQSLLINLVTTFSTSIITPKLMINPQAYPPHGVPPIKLIHIFDPSHTSNMPLPHHAAPNYYLVPPHCQSYQHHQQASVPNHRNTSRLSFNLHRHTQHYLQKLSAAPCYTASKNLLHIVTPSYIAQSIILITMIQAALYTPKQ